MKALSIRATGFLLLMLASRDGPGATFHVDGATGDDLGNSGMSWSSPFATIQRAVQAADASPGVDELLVAEGTYYGSVSLTSPVDLAGGYPRGGGVRDPVAHPVVLTNFDWFRDPVHVSTGAEGTRMDGLRVHPGVCALVGIRIEANDIVLSASTVQGCTGRGVLATGSGVVLQDLEVPGGVEVYGSDTRVIGCRFISSGGLVLHGATGAQVLENVFFGCPGGVTALSVSGDFLLIMNNRIEEWGLRCPDPLIVEPPPPVVEIKDGREIRFENNLFVRNRTCFCCISATNVPNLTVANVTVADNQGWGLTTGASPGVIVRDSVFRNNRPYQMPAGGYVDPSAQVSYSNVEGGFPGTGNIDADPLFTPGPFGEYYLSQLAAGQSATSPCVDAGSESASNLGYDTRTTRSDYASDAGTVDMGFHYPLRGLELLRGTLPENLTPYRSITVMPFVDDPGTLTDPAIPFLFYRIPAATRPIGVEKDLTIDAVRIDYR